MMRTLFLFHTLLVTLVALLHNAPPTSAYGVAGYYSDFDTWVQYVHDTCHPQDHEDDDEDTGDHLPSRQDKYKDEVFSKWVKTYKKVKPYKHYGKEVKSYGEGYKKYLPGRQLINEEEDTPMATPKMEKKSKKSKKDEKKPKKPHFKKPKKDKKGPKMQEPPTNSSFPAPPPSSPPSPPTFVDLSPTPTPVDSPIPNIRNISGDDVIVVAKDRSGDFTTVQAAINSVPVNNKKRVVIYVKKGIYREKVLIPSSKPFITLKGENAALTYIQWGDVASTLGKDGKPLSTYGSASVAIEADDFIALDISFKNTAPPPQSGAVGKQGVALRIEGDRAAFYRCGFYGAQDTLYDREGRHYYYKCYIEGSIDFIFGDARSLFVKCHIHSIAAPYGSIAAQKRLAPNENTGYSFAYCMVTGTGTIYLGRAWGAFSRVVYSFTYFDDIIVPQGWNDWNIPSNQKKVFYGEYRCYGPGANASGRVKWSRQLTPQQAKPFLSIAFIDGKEWLTK